MREHIARCRNGEGVELRQCQHAAVAGFADTIIQRLGLETSTMATRAGRVSSITAEQNADMHLVGFALEPFEKTADAVPAIVFVIVVRVFAAPFLAVDDEVLIRLRQFFEWKMDIDLFASACAQQILLRFAHFLTAKNADRALGDRKRTIGNCAIEIDRDGAAEAAAFRTRA